MRDPLVRLWHHGVAAQGARHGADCAAFLRDRTIRQAGEYGRTLIAMQDGLTIGAWRVIFYEDLREDPLFTLRGIEHFLDLPHAPYPHLAEFNDGPSPPLPEDLPPSVAATLARTRRDVEAAGFSPPDCWVL